MSKAVLGGLCPAKNSELAQNSHRMSPNPAYDVFGRPINQEPEFCLHFNSGGNANTGRKTFYGKFALVLVAAVILHGSLYPYDFRVHGGNPVAALIGSWAAGPGGRGDFLANILLYVPLGLFATLAMNRRVSICLVTLAGFALSSAVEILQFYDQGRITSASDIYLNTIGTCVGAAAGSALRPNPALRGIGRLHAVPCALLLAMLGYRLFPYVPTIDLHKYWNSLKPVLLHPTLNPYDVFRYFAIWLAVSHLLANAAVPNLRWAVPIFFAASVLIAKVIIVSQSISLQELVGLGFALAAWLLALQYRVRAAWFVAAALCAAIALQRLQPFDFAAPAIPFDWLPFRGFMSGSLAANIQSFLEKIFLYGSLIWIPTTAGTSIQASTLATATLLLITSVAETHLPGRSGEITDAVMALVLGAIIAAVEDKRGGMVSKVGPGASLHSSVPVGTEGG